MEDDIAFELRVYPFLAIVSHIQYTYKDSPQNLQDVKFLTTPWGKEILSDDRYEDLKEYTLRKQVEAFYCMSGQALAGGDVGMVTADQVDVFSVDRKSVV